MIGDFCAVRPAGSVVGGVKARIESFAMERAFTPGAAESDLLLLLLLFCAVNISARFSLWHLWKEEMPFAPSNVDQ